ncbi:MAG: HDOD domain-containing protein [Planctomycetes bacterium]|nr:HDOD domain-containing protein [Planctomycetota bacterium]
MLTTSSNTKFARIFSRLTDLPSLPRVVDRLLQLPENASVRDFANLIQLDQGMTAKVLKLVNSAFYSLKTPVSNLPQACSLLGIRTVKSLVLSVSVMQAFKRRCEGFDPVQFWRNGLATALVARKIALKVSFPPEGAEEVYIGGLLHASGIPLFAQYYPKEYAEILKLAALRKKSLLLLEEEEFGAAHPEAGGLIAAHWRLPPTISTVVRFHRAPPGRLPADTPFPVIQKIDCARLAEFWTRRAQIYFCQADLLQPADPPPIAKWMNFSEEALNTELGNVSAAVAELEGFIQGQASY